MSKSKNSPPVVLPDDADSISVRFYISASEPPGSGVPRVTFEFPGQNKRFDHAISEYSSLTGAQKNNLRSMLVALRDETYTLEGFA